MESNIKKVITLLLILIHGIIFQIYYSLSLLPELDTLIT